MERDQDRSISKDAKKYNRLLLKTGLTEEAVQAINIDYNKGFTLASLEEKYKLTIYYIRIFLIHGGSLVEDIEAKSVLPYATKSLQDAVITSYRANGTLKSVSLSLNLSIPVVREILTANDIKINKQGKRRTLALEKDIVNDYLTSGDSLRVVAERYSYTQEGIRQILQRNAIDIVGQSRGHSLDAAQWKLLLKDYESGINALTICRKYEITLSVLCNMLELKGFKKISLRELTKLSSEEVVKEYKVDQDHERVMKKFYISYHTLYDVLEKEGSLPSATYGRGVRLPDDLRYTIEESFGKGANFYELFFKYKVGLLTLYKIKKHAGENIAEDNTVSTLELKKAGIEQDLRLGLSIVELCEEYHVTPMFVKRVQKKVILQDLKQNIPMVEISKKYKVTITMVKNIYLRSQLSGNLTITE